MYVLCKMKKNSKTTKILINMDLLYKIINAKLREIMVVSYQYVIYQKNILKNTRT